MFVEPYDIALGGVSKSLARVEAGVNRGVFRAADGLTQLIISHNYGAKTRRLYRLDVNKIASDPFTAGLSRRVSASIYVVMEHPPVGEGYTATELSNLFVDFAEEISSQAGLSAKFVGGES